MSQKIRLLLTSMLIAIAALPATADPAGYSAPSTAPEPLSLLLAGSGLIGLALWGRGRRAPARVRRVESRDFPMSAVSKTSPVAQFPVIHR